MEHHFEVEAAIKYGVEAAVIIKCLQWWIGKNKANKKHQNNGRTWMYNSVKAFQVIFPYWTPRQIWRTVQKLIDDGIILKGNFSDKKNDRTLWYAFADEAAFLSEFDILPNGKMASPNGQIHFTKRSNPFHQTVKCIGTVTKEPVNVPVHSNEISNPFSFARKINEIIPAKSVSDWTAFINIGNNILYRRDIKTDKSTHNQFNDVIEIAREAAKAKVQNKIALFFSLLAEKTDYKKQTHSRFGTIGRVFQQMGMKSK